MERACSWSPNLAMAAQPTQTFFKSEPGKGDDSPANVSNNEALDLVKIGVPSVVGGLMLFGAVFAAACVYGFAGDDEDGKGYGFEREAVVPIVMMGDDAAQGSGSGASGTGYGNLGRGAAVPEQGNGFERGYWGDRHWMGG
ncbi:uncharacterized protein B0H64DRAFT_431289 [Chaetomium fimeti]|uniref:Transmembrane protein n=1 Tax=Chaetomium fimeti TaxID=1854472 RepID=A0AAE0HIQ4_9PEZI|nr:hypothetical protein B0H64DRAFT_431289 [Chaetomium fimeti]